ncbi:MAG TPA: cupin domain-containing protein [Chloroflexota bacterium]|nr:cupin domain-containing protein [Chloroflexota bacterium]
MSEKTGGRSYGRTTDPAAYGDQLAAGPMLQYDVSSEAESLMAAPSYRRGEPSGKTLLKEPDLRLVLLALKAGTQMREHDASGPVAILVFRGRCRVRTEDRTFELGPGGLLTLEPDIEHDVLAVEDSVLILSIGRTRYAVESTETVSRH